MGVRLNKRISILSLKSILLIYMRSKRCCCIKILKTIQTKSKIFNCLLFYYKAYVLLWSEYSSEIKRIWKRKQKNLVTFDHFSRYFAVRKKQAAATELRVTKNRSKTQATHFISNTAPT